MSDDSYDDRSGSQDPFYYDDTVSQRAMAFCHLAKLTDSIKDESVKELCLTMLRKINANVRSPATGELRSIERALK
jgi:hypothetical protein